MTILETMQSWVDGEPVWPYAKIIETYPELEHYQRSVWRRMKQAEKDGFITFDNEKLKAELDAGLSMWQQRDQYVVRFGFAIPCAELIAELATSSPIIEVGAGTGYMTKLMRNHDIDVLGSDLEQQGFGFKNGVYDEDQLVGGAKWMAMRYPARTVFCSWPSPNEKWFGQLLKAMPVGQRLIVIREGATAEATAWQYLDQCFDEITSVDLPVFPYMNDYASVHIKRRQRRGASVQP